MIKLAVRYLRQSLASPTGFLLITTGSGYAFAYLYLVVMGRVLGPEAFGILGALFAIFYIACLVGQALREAIATNVAEVRARAGEVAAVGTYIKLGIRLGLLCLLPSLAFILAARPVAAFFHLSSSLPVIVLAFSLFTALALDVVLGFQQGFQRFRDLGLTGYLTSQGLKLLFGVAFVLVGWDLTGAVGALLASTTVATLLGLALVRKQVLKGVRSTESYHPRLGPILLPTLILALFLSMPASVDVMLVTHFFGGKEAGLYNSVATVGKVVIFLPMAVSFILLPRVTESHALGGDTRNTLLQSLGIAFALSGTVTLISWGFPDLIVRLFFGRAYLEAVYLVSWYATAMLLFSLNVVLVHYSLAIRDFRLLLLADLVTLAEVVAISLFHQSLSQVVWILFWGNFSVLVVGFPYLALRRPKHQLQSRGIG